MPVNNPLFNGHWTWKKFSATVIDDIWQEVTFFVLIATAVTLVSELTDANLGVSNQLLTVLGLVLGLVISFRTSSAYERYQDGRKMWVNILVASRNLAKMIWIHVSNDRPIPTDTPDATKQTDLDVIIEKKTMVGLVQAFSVSVKHLLRGEQGPYYHDLYPLIAFLPRFANRPSTDLVEGLDDEKLPLWNLRNSKDHLRHVKRIRHQRHQDSYPNIPAVVVNPSTGNLPPGLGNGDGMIEDPQSLLSEDNNPANTMPSGDNAGPLPPKKMLTRQNSNGTQPGAGSMNSSKRNSINVLDFAPGTLTNRERDHPQRRSTTNTMTKHDREQTLVSLGGPLPSESVLRSRPQHAQTGWTVGSRPESPNSYAYPLSPPILFPPPPKRSDTFFDPEADVLPRVFSEVLLRPAREPPQYTVFDYVPLFRFFRWLFLLPGRLWKGSAGRRVQKGDDSEKKAGSGGEGEDNEGLVVERPPKKKRMAYADIVESQIPLEILVVLHNYLAFLIKQSLINPAMATGISNNLNLLQDTVANLERICNTPLPFAYQAHLRMSLWIYLALLPFQLVNLMSWVTIPATLFASFLLLGFLEIGQEIENPFNYDLNDLDLDHFCLSIQRDLHEITATIYSEPSSFIYTIYNQPFAPVDWRSADELTSPKRPIDSSSTTPVQALYTCPPNLVPIVGKDESGPDGYMGPPGGYQVEPGLSSIKRTLVACWRHVDEKTRER